MYYTCKETNLSGKEIRLIGKDNDFYVLQAQLCKKMPLCEHHFWDTLVIRNFKDFEAYVTWNTPFVLYDSTDEVV